MRTRFFTFLICAVSSGGFSLAALAVPESPAAKDSSSSAALSSTGVSAAVNALVESALKGHPSLEAIEAQIESLDHGIPQAFAWPDAQLGAEYSNMPVLSPWPGNHPMSGIQLKLAQKIPFPTKFSARAAAAIATRDAALPALEEKKNRIASQVRLLAVRWQMTRALRKVTVEHVAAVKQLLDTVRIKYELGRVEQHDLLRLEVLSAKLIDDLVEFDRQSDAIAATLNAVSQRPVGSKIDLELDVEVDEIETKSVEELLDEAGENRPLLQVFAAKAAAERVNAETKRTEVFPDVTAWAGYRIRLPSGADTGDNFITAGISVPLPWSSAGATWEEKALAHEAKAKSAEAARRGALLSLKGDLDAQQIKYKRAIERVKVYQEELIPAADKTLEAAFASYQVDRAGFAELFSAEISVLEFERIVVRAQVEAAVSIINIDTLTGRYFMRQKEKS